MDTGSKAAAARLLNPNHAQLNGQQRVNAEIFTAMEILGRKLSHAETARDDLARRLALFESAAAVDEKTGKLYLPVALGPDMPQNAAFATPKWMVASSMMSSAVALCALGLVLFHEPAPPVLTKQQIAALELLKSPRLAMLQWKTPSEIPAEPPAPVTVIAAPPVPPSVAEAPPVPVQTPEQPESVAAADAPASVVSPAVVPEPEPPLAASAVVPQAPPPETAPAPAELPDTSELTKQEQTAELPKQAAPSPDPAAEPAQQAVRVEDVFIPGEDKPVAKEEKAEAKKQEVVKAANGEAAPDPALPEQLSQLEKRAFQGIPEAQHDLATLYASGKMMPQDYKHAFYWFNKAADNGVANAHYNIGVIYQQGLGVPPNMTTAISWYEKAAELGHPEAMYNLGIAYIEGVGTKTNVERGIAFFKRAANAGVAQAAYNLGVLHESNFIGAIDTGKAVEWYRVAANQGHAEARSAIGRLTGEAMPPGIEQAYRLADTVEPAAGEEYGEGDSSPIEEETRAIASRVQQELVRQGLLPGKAIGTTSPQIEDAIRAYQRKVGLPADGQPSRALLEKMRQASAGN
jgi:TPR repeat protein